VTLTTQSVLTSPALQLLQFGTGTALSRALGYWATSEHGLGTCHGIYTQLPSPEDSENLGSTEKGSWEFHPTESPTPQAIHVAGAAGDHCHNTDGDTQVYGPSCPEGSRSLNGCSHNKRDRHRFQFRPNPRGAKAEKNQLWWQIAH
jgi:hypothetical protein